MVMACMMQNASIKNYGKRMQFLSSLLEKIHVIDSLTNRGLDIGINKYLKSKVWEVMIWPDLYGKS